MRRESATSTVKRLSEAFQLFETQNGRGKPLEAYNRLKAYHIRAMVDAERKDKIECDVRWEDAALYSDKQKISIDLSKPMRRYDNEIEYIPTQFICEFIKVFTGASGIKFSSSLHPSGNNFVIFVVGEMFKYQNNINSWQRKTQRVAVR